MPYDHFIPNLSKYNESMRLSMFDKAFFLDKTDAKVFVDFGCADGTLFKFLKDMMPENDYIGYDVNPEMIKIANEAGYPIFFTADWDEALRKRDEIKNGRKTAVVLSSIIHEIYSYLSTDEIKEFWDKIWNSGFDYVIIRDMMVSRTTGRPSDVIQVAKVRQKHKYPHQIQEHEAEWGTLEGQWSLLQFLLTYRYQENWAREVRENYFPVNLEDFLHKIPNTYTIKVIDHFVLPYIRDSIKRDFDIDVVDRTHIKLVLSRN